jgi:UDP-N-acetylmuramate--alanine ligase
MKIKIGVIFGGLSKEREISFAGGRTVYDNLNKSLFEAVPVFVDSFGNFILLDWELVYKGSIRDFYPSVEYIPEKKHEFQIYAESIDVKTDLEKRALGNNLGKLLNIEELKQYFDFAFLCLHGPYGEDGRIQGLLEYLKIPYSGSGIFSSAVGINKIIQKQLISQSGFNQPKYLTVDRETWLSKRDVASVAQKIENQINFPCVIKAPTQGSSIGISILHNNDPKGLEKAIDKSFFIRSIQAEGWNAMNEDEKIEYIRTLSDIREGLGIPVKVNGQTIFHPSDLLDFTEQYFSQNNNDLLIESLDGESEIIIEGFIQGKEFSSIVVEGLKGEAICLPPTEIRKGKELFDYRSKYLPGLSRKITPINLPDEQINSIRKECERLFKTLNFGVYARIDGFISDDGKVFLNDPNTTSGMMPSSFFFHQAAEIGFNPSQFITYIIYTSLQRRKREFKYNNVCEVLIEKLNNQMASFQKLNAVKKNIAVIFGGYSSERHISVESGRNIYEKLSSSAIYNPIPVFLSGSDEQHELYTIPINVMLKDNADDILEKVGHYHIHPVIEEIKNLCSALTLKFGDAFNLKAPEQITYKQLAEKVDEVFIALHGRPGEDGAIQLELEKVGLPYNGSNAESSSVTIDKFRTNEILKNHGLLVAEHCMVYLEEWKTDPEKVYEKVEKIGYPLIAKPSDDGCSSAVKKIKNREDLDAFIKLIFRTELALDEAASLKLKIKEKEEFPRKKAFLIEKLIEANGAKTFLEVTGGLLTHLDDNGNIVYEMFEASESLAEGEVLSLEEKFLAGQGQNITPARYAKDEIQRSGVSEIVKQELEKVARILNIRGYARIDAFVRIFENGKVEVVIIEVNSLPGMTPATCIFHQCAINGYKPAEFIEKIMNFAVLSGKSDSAVIS